MTDNLQDRYAPNGICFGCGSANEKGLQIKSRIEDDEVVCRFHPASHHQAFEGFVNGGILGVILDCHMNWAGAYALMQSQGIDHVPHTVTAEFSVQFKAPTPADRELVCRAKVISVTGRRATVEAVVEVDGAVTATGKGTFVSVKTEHPAHERWK